MGFENDDKGKQMRLKCRQEQQQQAQRHPIELKYVWTRKFSY